MNLIHEFNDSTTGLNINQQAEIEFLPEYQVKRFVEWPGLLVASVLQNITDAQWHATFGLILQTGECLDITSNV